MRTTRPTITKNAATIMIVAKSSKKPASIIDVEKLDQVGRSGKQNRQKYADSALIVLAQCAGFLRRWLETNHC
ncbi:MAG: hypothetical protein ACO3RV_06795 [Luteolibacter sp.]